MVLLVVQGVVVRPTGYAIGSHAAWQPMRWRRHWAAAMHAAAWVGGWWVCPPSQQAKHALPASRQPAWPTRIAAAAAHVSQQPQLGVVHQCSLRLCLCN